MNRIFGNWIKEAAMERTDEFTSKMIIDKIMDERGTSMYIGSVSSVGWYLGRLEGVVKVKEGIYKVAIE